MLYLFVTERIKIVLFSCCKRDRKSETFLWRNSALLEAVTEGTKINPIRKKEEGNWDVWDFQVKTKKRFERGLQRLETHLGSKESGFYYFTQERRHYLETRSFKFKSFGPLRSFGLDCGYQRLSFQLQA